MIRVARVRVRACVCVHAEHIVRREAVGRHEREVLYPNPNPNDVRDTRVSYVCKK